MKASARDYNVFLSASWADRPLAETISRSLTQAGLRVFNPSSLPIGESITESINDVIARSDAIIVVLPVEEVLSANIAVEFGAAMAWHKPIYLISPKNGETPRPTYMRNYRIYPLSRIDDVVLAIKQGQEPLTPDYVQLLQEIYQEMNIPVDSLMLNPSLVDDLAKRFLERTGSDVSGEKLVNEMLRLRKQGKWPRRGMSKAAKP